MADKTIGSLPSVESVNDDSLIPAEQQGEAVKVTGAQFKSFAQKSVAGIADQAQGYANQAAQSAAEAAEKVEQIGDAVSQTQANKEAAQAAQDAAEAASQGVQEYANQAAESASQASTSAAEATLQAQKAEQYAESAQTAKNAAELAEADSQAAKTAAQLAQTSAEQARDSAATSATTAQESASEASQSASTAQQYSGNPPKPINGTWWIWNANSGAYEDTGIKSVLSIVKSYPSIAEMEADVGNMHEGDLVIIATDDISDPDNSKLYVHNGLTWNYLSDLSGIEGVGIANIEQTAGNHAPGTTDTYTITLTDGSEYSFTVYNGADGQGAGDMLKSTYDPQGKNTDIFSYVDQAVSGVTVTTDETPTQGSANPVQSGGVYNALSKKQDTITGQQGQVVGFDASGKPVAQAAPDTGVISFNGRTGSVTPSADDYSAGMIKFTDGQTFQQKYDSGQLTGPAGADGAPGAAGPQGEPGKDGKSPYDVAVEQGYAGTEAEFYAALVSLNNAPFLPLSGGDMDQEAMISFGHPRCGLSGAYLDGVGYVVLKGSDDAYIEIYDSLILKSATGYISAFNAVITDLSEPERNTDAATKGYVDTAISSSITSALEASY